MGKTKTIGSMELERAALGSAFYSDEAADQVAMAGAEIFAWTPHQHIQSAIADLREWGMKVDLVSLTDKLKATGKLEAVGGTAYLIALMDTVPVGSNVGYYLTRVRDLYLKRRCHEIALKSANTAVNDEATDGASLLSQMMSELEALSREKSEGGPRHISEYARMAEAWLRQQEDRTISFGFPNLDSFVGPMRPGWLIAIGGQTGQGKSAFALQSAMHIQRCHGNVLYFSLEMTGMDMFMRIAAAMYNNPEQANVFATRLSRRSLELGDSELFERAIRESQHWRLYVDESSGLSIRDIILRTRVLKSKVPLAACVIDHANIVSEGGESIVEQMNRVYDGSQQMAHSLHIPVFLVCQYHKMADMYEPNLRDFYGSVKLAQNSDLVLALRPSAQSDDAFVHVLKARHGKQGVVKMRKRGLVWYDEV